MARKATNPNANKKMVKRSFAFPERLWEMIVDAEHRTGLSMGTLVRVVIRDNVDRYAGDKQALQKDVVLDDSAHRTSVQWPEELDEKINRVAEAAGVTQTVAVRVILFDNVGRYGKDSGQAGLVLEMTEELKAGLVEAARLWGMTEAGVAQLLLRRALPEFINEGREQGEKLKQGRLPHRAHS